MGGTCGTLTLPWSLQCKKCCSRYLFTDGHDSHFHLILGCFYITTCIGPYSSHFIKRRCARALPKMFQLHKLFFFLTKDCLKISQTPAKWQKMWSALGRSTSPVSTRWALSDFCAERDVSSAAHSVKAQFTAPKGVDLYLSLLCLQCLASLSTHL